MRELAWMGVGVTALLLGCASAPPAPAAGEKTVPGAQYLLGSEWELRDLGGTPVLEDHKPTLVFPAAGEVAGNASCNRFTGPADVGDGTLRVGALASTRMACTPEVDVQEKAFLVALQNSRRMELVGGELVVHTESLEQPLRFRRTR
ncbi:MAG TPA: META domain-containing protein [Myxococcaceae bacterium]|nr:META domain-containing protein [Myxococcaceae bacterium]